MKLPLLAIALLVHASLHAQPKGGLGAPAPAPGQSPGGFVVPGAAPAPPRGGFVLPDVIPAQPPGGFVIPGATPAPPRGGFVVPDVIPAQPPGGLAVPGVTPAPPPGGLAFPGLNFGQPQKFNATLLGLKCFDESNFDVSFDYAFVKARGLGCIIPTRVMEQDKESVRKATELLTKHYRELHKGELFAQKAAKCGALVAYVGKSVERANLLATEIEPISAETLFSYSTSQRCVPITSDPAGAVVEVDKVPYPDPTDTAMFCDPEDKRTYMVEATYKGQTKLEPYNPKLSPKKAIHFIFP